MSKIGREQILNHSPYHAFRRSFAATFPFRVIKNMMMIMELACLFLTSLVGNERRMLINIDIIVDGNYKGLFYLKSLSC